MKEQMRAAAYLARRALTFHVLLPAWLIWIRLKGG